MALLDPVKDWSPRCCSRFTRTVAGAESNVAVGLIDLHLEADVLDEVGAAVHALRGTGDWETLPRLAQVTEELGV